jgi:hypothetical protein
MFRHVGGANQRSRFVLIRHCRADVVDVHNVGANNDKLDIDHHIDAATDRAVG